MSDPERPFTPGQRPTEIGPYSATQRGTSRQRAVPVPWIDCEQCGWRHYPSTSGGSWHIATTCVSCGHPLPGLADNNDDGTEVPNGVEATDDDGEDRT